VSLDQGVELLAVLGHALGEGPGERPRVAAERGVDGLARDVVLVESEDSLAALVGTAHPPKASPPISRG
jgi:hypothetical protein